MFPLNVLHFVSYAIRCLIYGLSLWEEVWRIYRAIKLAVPSVHVFLSIFLNNLRPITPWHPCRNVEHPLMPFLLATLALGQGRCLLATLALGQRRCLLATLALGQRRCLLATLALGRRRCLLATLALG
jgi:hypothetical protein